MHENRVVIYLKVEPTSLPFMHTTNKTSSITCCATQRPHACPPDIIPQADVWSLGCILLELVIGHAEFCRLWMTAYDHEQLKVRVSYLMHDGLFSCARSGSNVSLLRYLATAGDRDTFPTQMLLRSPFGSTVQL